MDPNAGREDMPSFQRPKRVMQPQAKAYGGGGLLSQGSMAVYANQHVMADTPFPGTDGGCSKLPPLPDGVPNVDTWGYTLIEFGQFKNASIRNQELVASTEERAVAYVKWCRSRSRSATGQLKDLCDYLAHHFAELEDESGPIIPGTGMVRRLKK